MTERVLRSIAEVVRVTGSAPLVDQQVAGLIIWVGAGLAYRAVILGVLVRLLHEEEQREAVRRVPTQPVS